LTRWSAFGGELGPAGVGERLDALAGKPAASRPEGIVSRLYARVVTLAVTRLLVAVSCLTLILSSGGQSAGTSTPHRLLARAADLLPYFAHELRAEYVPESLCLPVTGS
jgi:hypothetical protein